jgi:hypothetical protein
VSDQLSLFAGDPAGPNLDDLQGLLVGPGQAVRRQGTARLSVIVAAQWRADALLAEFAARGLPGDQSVADGDGIVVRTEFSGELAGLADRWLRGAVKSPPPGCALGAGSLRLWAIAAGANSVPANRKSAASDGGDGSNPNGGEPASAGAPDHTSSENEGTTAPAGFLLRLGHTDRPAYPTIGRLLDRVGIPGTYVGVRAGGPAYRITGRRRLAVLRAYVGEPPPGADGWPDPSH